MSLFDPTPDYRSDFPQDLPRAEGESGSQPQADPENAPLAGDPITYAAIAPPPPASRRLLRDDIRVPWSWGHFIVFLFFTVTSFIVVQTALAVYYAPHQRMSKEQM